MRIEVDDNGVVADFEKKPRQITDSLVKRMARVGAGLVRFIKADELSGQLLDARTGTGRRSIFYRLETRGTDEATVVVGSDLEKARYMRAQDRGATVTPKAGEYLTIPLDAARTGTGVPRFTARQVIASPESFGYVGTFFRKHVLFGKRSSDDIVPLFALVRSVKLKPVGYLSNALREKGQWATDELAAGIGEVL